MNTPLLTVIIPVYNVSPYLRKAMDSVLDQTYRNLEIICVDDGSTDGSLDILREYEAQDPRVHVFVQPNAGVAAARNVALDAATGEWLVGMDPDDWLESHAYETAMRGIRDDVELVIFGVRVIPEGGSGLEEEVQGRQRYYNHFSAGFRKLDEEEISRLSAPVWNKLYRRSVIEENSLRFEEELRSNSDTCFSACLYAHVKAAFFIDEPLYCHVLRLGSISFNRTQEKEERYCAMNVLCMEKILRYYLKEGLVDQHPAYLLHLLTGFCRTINVRSKRGGTQKKWMETFGIRLRDCFRNSPPSLEKMLRKPLSKMYHSMVVKNAVISVLALLPLGQRRRRWCAGRKGLYAELIPNLRGILKAWKSSKQQGES